MKNFCRLIRFELRKSFSSPWMIVFLVCLLLMNGWKLQSEYAAKTTQISQYQPVYEEFYDRWSGEITAETITELMTIFGPLQPKYEMGSASNVYDPNAYTYSEYTDAHFFATQFYTEMQYDYLYQNEAVRIVENARNLQELYSGVGNAYEVRKNAAVAEIFKGRTIRQFGDTHWVEVWLNHDYSAMLVLLLCLFGLCTVFVTERETEMYMLLRTAKNGGGATVAAKLTASALFAVAVSVLFFAEDILVPLALSGRPEALSSPIYAIRYLETTPLNMTIGQFQIWTVAVKTLGILGCAAVAGLFYWASRDLPDLERLTGYEAPQATVILARDGSTIGTLATEKRYSITLKEMSPWLPMSFLAAEDDSFYQHHGVDPVAIVRAFIYNLRNKASGGGQQGGGFAVNLMAGGLATAHIIVIHRRQVIEDQRGGMRHFHRARCGIRLFQTAAADPAELVDQHGADTLAAGSQGMAHGIIERIELHVRC